MNRILSTRNLNDTARELAETLGFDRTKICAYGDGRTWQRTTLLPTPASPKMTGLRFIDDGFDLWLDEACIRFRYTKVKTLTSDHLIVEATASGEIDSPWLYSLAEFDSIAGGFVADALERGRSYEVAEEIRLHQSAIETGHGRIYAD